MKPGTKQLTATGDISTDPVRIYSIICHSGGSAGNWTLKDDGTSGTEFDYIAGTADKSVRVNYEGGLFFPNGAHLTEDDASNCVYATIVYEHMDA